MSKNISRVGIDGERRERAAREAPSSLPGIPSNGKGQGLLWGF
jgi:hypothetical protein